MYPLFLQYNTAVWQWMYVSMQAALCDFSVARSYTVPFHVKGCYVQRLFRNHVLKRKKYQVDITNKLCSSSLILWTRSLLPPRGGYNKQQVKSWSALRCAHSFSTVPLSSLRLSASVASLLLCHILHSSPPWVKYFCFPSTELWQNSIKVQPAFVRISF